MEATDQIQKHPYVNRHMTVRIPRGMTEAIKDFLKTEQAARMGFDSRADVVTAAVRKLLNECGYYNNQKNIEENI
jgi:Arc/MetJ-type ribon-helix-helix transcriptional regulator